MKRLARDVASNAFSLFILTQFLSGIKISGGFQTFIFGGFFLSLMGFFLRPLLNLVALPFNFLTLGLSSFLVNALILYVLTILVPQISVVPFVFPGFSFGGVIVQEISFNLFFAYIASSIVLSVIIFIVRWLIKD